MTRHCTRCIESAAAVAVGPLPDQLPQHSTLWRSTLGLYWPTGSTQCSAAAHNISTRQKCTAEPRVYQYVQDYYLNPKPDVFKSRVCTINTHTHTHTHVQRPFVWDYLDKRKNKCGFYWSKRQWVAVVISWAICKSEPRSRPIATPAPHHLVVYRPDALPATQPMASKHWRQSTISIQTIVIPHESDPKWHPNWFSHFCRAHHVPNTETDTDHGNKQTTCVATGRIDQMEPNNNNRLHPCNARNAFFRISLFTMF